MKRIFIPLFVMVVMNLSITYGNHTPVPGSVTITGSFQEELGCPGDWQPDCASTNLGYDSDDDLWQEAFSIPAGNWEYKATLNGSWDEHYGSNAIQNGPNITLSLASSTEVKFYYDHETHWVTDNQHSIIATVPGNYQSAIGCSGDWDPGCLRSWLQDADGNGVYSFSTSDIPAGSYEVKVTHNESWDENYGLGGVPGGSNIPFTVDQNEIVHFEYDPSTHIMTISTESTSPPGPTSVTVVGDFQDELGCPGDWQPECSDTHLSYDADNDTWRGTFQIPAGNYQVKVTHNNSWDENYGEGGILNGSNIPFSVADNEMVAFEYDPITHILTITSIVQPTQGPIYAVIHYHRDTGDYGDHTTGNYNDYWGLHLWGDIDETIEWTSPKPFLGEDEYGRFAWVQLQADASNVGFIVHRGDAKDGTDADRFFNPTDNPEIWLKSGDANIYTSQAEAQDFVTIHYHRDDGDYGDPTSDDFYDFWGMHLWGDAISPSEITSWTDPKRFDGIDDYGSFFTIQLQDASQPVNFILHRGDQKDPDNSPDRSFIPLETATVWLKSGDINEYSQRGAAENFSTLHYHRPLGDYGDFTSNDFNDFWGLHTWGGAPDPGWTTPLKPEAIDVFGLVFKVDLLENAEQMSYIVHRGDEKDPGPDQTMTFSTHGYEVWQLVGADPERPYILPILVEVNNPPSLSVEENTVNANEGQIAINGGTVSDADDDAVTLNASIGTVVNNNNGTWNWFFITSDGPDESQMVIITADDGNGGNAQVTFDLTINNVAPTINSVSNDGPIIEGNSVNIDVDATDPAGVNDLLSYAFDCDDDGFFEIGPQAADFATCNFDVSGNFTVNVKVTDDDGDEDLDGTIVVVLTPQQGIDDFIISEVEDLFNQGDLNWGQGNSLITKLLNAIALLNKGNKKAAINILGAFINQVNDFIGEGILSPGEGQVLIDAANVVINTI